MVGHSGRNRGQADLHALGHGRPRPGDRPRTALLAGVRCRAPRREAVLDGEAVMPTDPHPVEGERRWRVAEYAPLYGGLTGSTLVGWQATLAGPQPSNHERLMPEAEHEEKLRQEREEREGVEATLHAIASDARQFLAASLEINRSGEAGDMEIYEAVWHELEGRLDSLPATPKEGSDAPED